MRKLKLRVGKGVTQGHQDVQDRDEMPVRVPNVPVEGKRGKDMRSEHVREDRVWGTGRRCSKRQRGWSPGSTPPFDGGVTPGRDS